MCDHECQSHAEYLQHARYAQCVRHGKPLFLLLSGKVRHDGVDHDGEGKREKAHQPESEPPSGQRTDKRACRNAEGKGQRRAYADNGNRTPGKMRWRKPRCIANQQRPHQACGYSGAEPGDEHQREAVGKGGYGIHHREADDCHE